MDVIRGIENFPAGLRDAAVTIGNFDGVHLGHRRLITRLLENARQENLQTLVITFDPHPKMILRPELQPFYLISTLDEKIRLLAETGIDAAVIIPFSLQYAEITATEFVCKVLWEGLHIRKIVIGHDYTFGKGKEGNEAFLAAFGKKLGFAVDVINAVGVGDTIISSTEIRDAILSGNVKKAAALLGRPYNLGGLVVEGNRRGAGLGFPTANIVPEKVLIPPRGIYAVIVRVKGTRHQGVVNIGFNPTFDDRRLSIEAHILDFHEDIYGERVDLLFIERIRDEVKFPGPEELIRQIRRDVDQARTIFKTLPGDGP